MDFYEPKNICEVIHENNRYWSPISNALFSIYRLSFLSCLSKIERSFFNLSPCCFPPLFSFSGGMEGRMQIAILVSY